MDMASNLWIDIGLDLESSIIAKRALKGRDHLTHGFSREFRKFHVRNASWVSMAHVLSPRLSALKNLKLLLFYIRRTDMAYPTSHAMLGDNVLGELITSPIQVIRGFTIFEKADVWQDIARNMTTKRINKEFS